MYKSMCLPTLFLYNDMKKTRRDDGNIAWQDHDPKHNSGIWNCVKFQNVVVNNV